MSDNSLQINNLIGRVDDLLLLAVDNSGFDHGPLMKFPLSRVTKMGIIMTI